MTEKPWPLQDYARGIEDAAKVLTKLAADEDAAIAGMYDSEATDRARCAVIAAEFRRATKAVRALFPTPAQPQEGRKDRERLLRLMTPEMQINERRLDHEPSDWDGGIVLMDEGAYLNDPTFYKSWSRVFAYARKAQPPEGVVPDGWRPIESAPKDGSVLGYSPLSRESKRISLVQLKDGEPFIVDGAFAFDRPPPTHWMPLPAAPKEAK